MVRFKTFLFYRDYVLIYFRKLEDIIKHVYEVFMLLENAGVFLKIRKLQFIRKILDYLFHVLLLRRIDIAKDSTSVIAQANFPQDITQLRSFLGVCNVYRHFIKSFSQMSEPLNRSLCKDVKPTWLDPPEKQLPAYQSLNKALIEPPPSVLSLPVANRSFLLDKDSFAYQIGVTLLHQQADENPTN